MSSEAITWIEEHDRQMEALAAKYLGAAELARGRGLSDLFWKKQWYANRIHQLGVSEGRNAMRMKRCRRTDSPIYQKYEAIETELRQVVDHLILEMIALDRTERS